MDAMATAALWDESQSLLAAERWNLACEALSRVVEREVAAHGEQSLQVARFYLAYAVALLQHWRSAQSRVVDRMKAALGDRQAMSALMDDAAEPEQEDVDDRLALDMFDYAHAIYAQHYKQPATTASCAPPATDSSSSSSSASSSPCWCSPSPPSNRELGLSLMSVLLRRGDLRSEHDQWSEAFDDYAAALHLAQQLLPAHHADIAATHSLLAVCKISLKQPSLALFHYTAAYTASHYQLLSITQQAHVRQAAMLQRLGRGDVRLSEDLTEEKQRVEAAAAELERGWASAEQERRQQTQDCRQRMAGLKERIDEIKEALTRPAAPQPPPLLFPAAASSSSSSSSSSSASAQAASGFASSPFSIPTLSLSSSAAAFAFSPATAASPGGEKRRAETEEADRAAAMHEGKTDGEEPVSLPQVKRKKTQ